MTPLVIVTPVYEDAQASGRLFRELAAVFGAEVHVIAVDDGSVREPVGIASLADAGLRGTVLTLKRNEGHQRALAVGLSYVSDHFGDAARCIVTMDSDGEDLPASINALMAMLMAKDVDVVVAGRKSRVETLRFRVFYQIYRRVFHLLTGRRISFGNFMAMKPAAAARLTAMHELWIHVAGCVLASKLRIGDCLLDRGPRYAGRSKLNFVGLALHGFRGLMVFAEDVLVRVGIACAAVAGLSMAGMIVAVVLKLAGQATPGWFSVALGILLLVFIQTGTLTLTMLMLTGLVRGNGGQRLSYKDMIRATAHTHDDSRTVQI
jgi:glycosyltransferase involved in cell wall biosynthesis